MEIKTQEELELFEEWQRSVRAEENTMYGSCTKHAFPVPITEMWIGEYGCEECFRDAFNAPPAN